MEDHFNHFKNNIIGNDLIFNTPYGKKKMIYADWIASGRLYAPIEDKISNTFGPFVGNTHTETSETGTLMTKAYHYAHKFIKKHVNANENDVSILESFSKHLGLAYQIQDDVLDVTTSEKVLGKRQNSDAIKNKPSYPSIIGLDESIKTFENLYQSALDELPKLSVESQPLRLLTKRLVNRAF